jgi:serine/alanine adding enzyme
LLTQLGLYDESDSARWDAFVNSHADGTPFHLTGWLRTLAEAYNFRPLLFASLDKTGMITALAPFIKQKPLIGRYRLVSLPFTDYCFPLGLEKSNITELLKGIIEEPALRAKYVEIRGRFPEPGAFIPVPYYMRHLLRLHSDPQQVLKGIDRRTIVYNIRRARQAGVEIIEDNSQNGISEFFRLNVLTRKKHGIPHQPREFFQAFARNLIDAGQAFILLASRRTHFIAAGVFLRHGKTVYYKYNASDPEILAKVSANHLLTWAAIERGCLEGYEIFDFGRTAPDNRGLMRYKRMWGAEQQELPYFYSHRPSALRSGPMILKHLG